VHAPASVHMASTAAVTGTGAAAGLLPPTHRSSSCSAAIAYGLPDVARHVIDTHVEPSIIE